MSFNEQNLNKLITDFSEQKLINFLKNKIKNLTTEEKSIEYNRLASPRLASPRLASPRLASPRLASIQIN